MRWQLLQLAALLIIHHADGEFAFHAAALAQQAGGFAARCEWEAQLRSCCSPPARRCRNARAPRCRRAFCCSRAAGGTDSRRWGRRRGAGRLRCSCRLSVSAHHDGPRQAVRKVAAVSAQADVCRFVSLLSVADSRGGGVRSQALDTLFQVRLLSRAPAPLCFPGGSRWRRQLAVMRWRA